MLMTLLLVIVILMLVIFLITKLPFDPQLKLILEVIAVVFAIVWLLEAGGFMTHHRWGRF